MRSVRCCRRNRNDIGHAVVGNIDGLDAQILDARLDIGVDDLLDPLSAYVSGADRIGVLDADRMMTVLLNPVDDLSPGGIGEGRHILAKLITFLVCFLKRSSVLVIARA